MPSLPLTSLTKHFRTNPNCQLNRALPSYLCVEPGPDHGHEVVDALDAGGVGQEVHDQVPQVARVGRGDDLHRRLKVLTLDRQERVARQGCKQVRGGSTPNAGIGNGQSTVDIPLRYILVSQTEIELQSQKRLSTLMTVSQLRFKVMTCGLHIKSAEKISHIWPKIFST